jgi:hypothetical protein
MIIGSVTEAACLISRAAVMRILVSSHCPGLLCLDPRCYDRSIDFYFVDLLNNKPPLIDTVVGFNPYCVLIETRVWQAAKITGRLIDTPFEIQ